MDEQQLIFDATAFLLKEKNRQIEEFLRWLLPQITEAALMESLSTMIQHDHNRFLLWQQCPIENLRVPEFLWNDRERKESKDFCKRIELEMKERFNLLVVAKLFRVGIKSVIECEVRVLSLL